MYLRKNGKKVDGEEYDYWTLVECIRTIRGPRQRIVASIGKLPGLDKEERLGWEEIGRILTGKPRQVGTTRFREGSLLQLPNRPKIIENGKNVVEKTACL